MGSLRENHQVLTKNNKLILKLELKFKSKKHNGFTEKVKKIALSDNHDEKISIGSIKRHAYGTNKYLLCKKVTKCRNIIKQYKTY